MTPYFQYMLSVFSKMGNVCPNTNADGSEPSKKKSRVDSCCDEAKILTPEEYIIVQKMWKSLIEDVDGYGKMLFAK